jgi:hypothetical protein
MAHTDLDRVQYKQGYLQAVQDIVEFFQGEVQV